LQDDGLTKLLQQLPSGSAPNKGNEIKQSIKPLLSNTVESILMSLGQLIVYEDATHLDFLY
jgi:hypothetical protein